MSRLRVLVCRIIRQEFNSIHVFVRVIQVNFGYFCHSALLCTHIFRPSLCVCVPSSGSRFVSINILNAIACDKNHRATSNFQPSDIGHLTNKNQHLKYESCSSFGLINDRTKKNNKPTRLFTPNNEISKTNVIHTKIST